MTERPILFSAEMVRAILDGRKTQTRRVCKFTDKGLLRKGKRRWHPDDPEALKACPYGATGDALWVRETWGRTTNVNNSRSWPNRAHIPMHGGEVVIFAADGHWQWCDGDGFATERSFWRPSIHMPRWASRIMLRITDARVERLQDISEDDARAEGWPGPVTEIGFSIASPIAWFANVWTSINGPGAWEANPWVWVVAFERVKP